MGMAENHPLTQPRISAALGLFGPLGVGVAIMTVAPPLGILFWFGFIVSLLGAAGTLWLFWPDRSRFTIWAGAIWLAICLEVLVPIGLLLNTLYHPEQELPGGSVQIYVFKSEKDGDGLNRYPIQIFNSGTARIIGHFLYSAQVAVQEAKTPSQEIEFMNIVEKTILEHLKENHTKIKDLIEYGSMLSQTNAQWFRIPSAGYTTKTTR
jgi:hypothetical protein